MSHLQLPPELNPFLGWRAIRFCLQERDIFRDQLRAILRASVEGTVKVMYPMISCLDELTKANELLEQCRSELRAEGIPFNENLQVGAMIEIPSAAITAASLAKRADFFSIGTNDLIQYSIAVDRMNEKIAHLYEPAHPAILRLIKMTVEAAHQRGIPVSVCGEMAGDPTYVPLLLGLGVDELSASPPSIPQIKFLIRRMKATEARELAEFALECEYASETVARARALTHRVAPGLFEEQEKRAEG
jgi:phosphotransferase system enzyme I (PtsI)